MGTNLDISMSQKQSQFQVNTLNHTLCNNHNKMFNFIKQLTQHNDVQQFTNALKLVYLTPLVTSTKTIQRPEGNAT